MVIILLAFLKKSRYGCFPVGSFKSPDMVVVLLAFLSPNMVVVLLAFLKKSRYGCCPIGLFKSPYIVILLAF